MSVKILALGDSWFHYPNGLNIDGQFVGDTNGVGNILNHLVEMYKLPLYYREETLDEMFDSLGELVVSQDDALGKCGEELMVMVYGYHRNNPGKKIIQRTWLDLLIDRIDRYKEESDTFIILLSGGGNDIADKNLFDFLNNVNDPSGPVKEQAIEKAIEVDIKAAYNCMIARVCQQYPELNFHFIVQGYSWPPVNGRGLYDLDKTLLQKLLHDRSPGPWLSPAFNAMQIPRPLAEQIIGDFIDRFNEMLISLNCESGNGFIHYVDLRDITNRLNREQGWCNELHFNRNSFLVAAARIYEVISPLLNVPS
ncbi:MAG: hypothetical protein ACHQRM_10735 [Bacteroidia bacterium]